MSLPLPSTLSPSKMAAFRDCALAFRFSAIDRIPEPPSTFTLKGTIVHRALEHLFLRAPAGRRSVAAALAFLDDAWHEADAAGHLGALGLEPEGEERLRAECEALVRRYFELEDPDEVVAVGVELTLEAPFDGVVLRGILDRLDVEDGRFVVTDYKTGRVPSAASEQARLGGVHFYAYLCERVLGERPARVQLLYLAEPVAISTAPTEQSTRALARRAAAVWAAVERACRFEDFRPRPSALCRFCSYQAWCPAFGGDPSLAPASLGAPPPAATRPPTGAPPPAAARTG
jgi:putative RecB family exonuclease